jgi:hypothetical protein
MHMPCLRTTPHTHMPCLRTTRRTPLRAHTHTPRSLYNNIKAPSQLQPMATYYLFKDGIQPKWEDPKNAHGGSWNCLAPRTPNSKGVLDAWWLHAVRRVCFCVFLWFWGGGGALGVAGAGVSLRAAAAAAASPAVAAERGPPPRTCAAASRATPRRAAATTHAPPPRTANRCWRASASSLTRATRCAA